MEITSLPAGPHRRLNQLTGEWLLVSPHRTARPWQGQVEETARVTRPPYDPECYLCPGNTRAGGVLTPEYSSTFVFDNDFAALLPDALVSGAPLSDAPLSDAPLSDAPLSDAPLSDEPVSGALGSGLLVAEAERGVCRVMCFDPRHDLTLAGMDAAAVRRVVDAWAEQTVDLGSIPWVGHVQIFENRGAMMGASNPHPHGQIWATERLPGEPAKEIERQRAYVGGGGGCLLCDYLEAELAVGQRVVCENEEFVALVPFWAVWPYETLVLPRRHAGALPALDDAGRDGLAGILQRLTRGYDRLFGVEFPYSMGFHQRPTDGAPHPELHVHAHFYPPLLRSATVRKFMVGFELLGQPQRDITAESAADRLRQVL
ncbi:UDP-glucose--hexose-1-phosphate uridylyltransferase [Actinoplanes sp. GCM10030250]|uniref:UDP-glucose--hexose-1-phosphate uridylyltransferase n=1 Tax=Actinoplanes sp. GCM10030250 TaxID=3273376 RepID=UPI0036186B26